MTTKEKRSVESLAWTKTDSTAARYVVVADAFNPSSPEAEPVISVSLRLALSTEAFQDSQGEERKGGKKGGRKDKQVQERARY